MASVRFICGTQDLHKTLEHKIAGFFGTDDAILYSSCFDANGGLFETLLDERDAIISDALNHASIIDGVRLSKARRYRYAHADMDDLEGRLRECADARCRLIATDGVFSMDGDLAPLADIVGLAERHDAMVMVDDSHATGFVGATGRGSAEVAGVLGPPGVETASVLPSAVCPRELTLRHTSTLVSPTAPATTSRISATSTDCALGSGRLAPTRSPRRNRFRSSAMSPAVG